MTRRHGTDQDWKHLFLDMKTSTTLSSAGSLSSGIFESCIGVSDSCGFGERLAIAPFVTFLKYGSFITIAHITPLLGDMDKLIVADISIPTWRPIQTGALRQVIPLRLLPETNLLHFCLHFVTKRGWTLEVPISIIRNVHLLKTRWQSIRLQCCRLVW